MSGTAGDHRATVHPVGGAGVPARTAVVAVCILLAALFTGCSSGAGTPSTLPATTQASAPTGTPSSSPSTSANDQAQIEAAVRTYFDAMDRAVKTGDTSAFVSVTASNCPCREFAKSVESKFKEGKLVGAGVVVSHVDVRRPSSARAVAGVTYTTMPYHEIAADGTSKSFAGSFVESSVVLIRTGSVWVVSAENVLERS